MLIVPTPARAALYGGLELGAKGIKSTVVDVTQGPNGLRVKILLAGTKNTTLVEGIATSGKFDALALKETAAAVRSTAEEMATKHKVPKDHIYVVASSGIFTPIAKDTKAVAANRAELIKAIGTVAGRPMDYITVGQEAQLSIVGLVPTQFLATSVLLDIGSGNTKGGYQVKAGEYALFDVPLGDATSTPLWQKKPAVHDPVLAVCPVAEQYCPAGHSWQSLTLCSPPTLSNVPLGHWDAFSPVAVGQYRPKAHTTGVMRSVQL